MANLVFLLGAGASKRAGVPLMGEFLDVAERLRRLGKAGKSAPDFDQVFVGISHLQQVHSKAVLDIQNVESVFAAFDMAAVLNKFGSYSAEEIAGLAPAMRSVIARTSELTLQFRYTAETGLRSPEPYEDFAKIVSGILENSKPPRSIAILTFNYDLALDHCLYRARIPHGYGFDGKGTREGILPLLKLHGSVNWFRCSECKRVAPWTMQELSGLFNFSRSGSKTIPFEVTPFAAEHHKHCDKPVLPEPVLVPPTWNKTEHHKELSAVWSLAAKELSDAEEIVLIGYSLPESDAFFRYLYALGAVGDRPLKLFLVVNPDDSAATQARFRCLLGPGAQQRFRYEALPFDGALPLLERLFA